MPEQSLDPGKAAADTLREKKGVDYGSAKLEQDSGEAVYVEYFRGKDLVRWIEANPGKLDHALKEAKSERKPDDTAAELVRMFLNRGFVTRTERKFKRPKPGRTRLVKWPRTLLPMRDQQWDPASFYAWRYDRPTSMWFYIASVAVPVVVILACLFPLAPWWARLGFVYFLMALLVAILGLLVVRYTLFAVIWATTGSSFWLFPNMMSDQVGILDAFKPAVSFEKSKSLMDQWQARLVTAFALVGLVWVLSSHSPDLTHLTEDLKQGHDAFRQYMETMYQNKTYLNGTADAPAGAGPRAGGGAGAGQAGRSKDEL